MTDRGLLEAREKIERGESLWAISLLLMLFAGISIFSGAL